MSSALRMALEPVLRTFDEQELQPGTCTRLKETTMKLFTRLALPALAFALVVPSAVVALGSASGAAAAGAYLRTTSDAVNLPNSGSVTLLSVKVPAGNWTVNAKATAVNFGSADYARCVISVNGSQIDASATLIGNQGAGPTGETGPAAATIANVGAFAAAGKRTVTYSCVHDFEQDGEYVDPGAALLVTKVSSLG
jgi:hypothetical protein